MFSILAGLAREQWVYPGDRPRCREDTGKLLATVRPDIDSKRCPCQRCQARAGSPDLLDHFQPLSRPPKDFHIVSFRSNLPQPTFTPRDVHLQTSNSVSARRLPPVFPHLSIPPRLPNAEAPTGPSSFSLYCRTKMSELWDRHSFNRFPLAGKPRHGVRSIEITNSG